MAYQAPTTHSFSQNKLTPLAAAPPFRTSGSNAAKTKCINHHMRLGVWEHISCIRVKLDSMFVACFLLEEWMTSSSMLISRAAVALCALTLYSDSVQLFYTTMLHSACQRHYSRIFLPFSMNISYFIRYLPKVVNHKIINHRLTTRPASGYWKVFTLDRDR